MNHAEFVTWAAEGHTDAMGQPFSAWLLAVEGPDGRPLRDAHNRVVRETQAQWLARQTAPINQAPTATAAAPQLELFA
jgi:hypothetical protein